MHRIKRHLKNGATADASSVSNMSLGSSNNLTVLTTQTVKANPTSGTYVSNRPKTHTNFVANEPLNNNHNQITILDNGGSDPEAH